jgi:glycosyltransferase involved in cell wall biosynthesis
MNENGHRIDEGQIATVPVSVVVPCFRCAKTIERAFKSVLAQSMLPVEIILIDDASVDGTVDVLKKLSADSAVKVVVLSLDKNGGAANARNAGWERATQPYIAFLDSDDAWHPLKLEVQYRYMQDNPQIALSGHGHRLLPAAVGLPAWPILASQATEIGKWTMVLSNQFVTPSVMIRRDVTSRFVRDQRHMEDHMLWLDVICSGAKGAKIPMDLVAIYKNSYGVAGLSSQMWMMELGSLRNCYRLYQRQNINELQYVLLSIYSIVKYVRRLIIYFFYMRWR